ncbi:AbrB/MazE/SpoVT family DNA-binding domain-containing protein [Microlunatus spumicola]|uniref:AbrB/MazE/SpoVT family DNA-binding domain-containing protein n=1 Tax=Microlunatus spumicola TaxID=81499 RepID=A0ABP6WQT2_9ACTN
MPTATMTTKGQLTVPAEVRERLGLRAGSRVSFVPTEDGTYELRVERGSVRDLAGLFPWDGPPKTLEEMDDAVAAGAAETVHRLAD